MFGRRMRFMTMMAAAVGIPYAWFNENFAVPVKTALNSLKGEYASMSARDTASTSESAQVGLTDIASVLPSNSSNSNSSLARPASVHQLADVLRFDVNPRWITERWERISTVRSEHDLEGLRVALVTGASTHDIAGSLTYYFDREQRVRRLTLHGQTGDERPLVAMATQRFNLKPEASLAAGMYVMRWNGKPINVLRITHAAIVRANAPNSRFQVELELNDPSGGYGLSRELLQSLQADSHVRRWGE